MPASLSMGLLLSAGMIRLSIGTEILYFSVRLMQECFSMVGTLSRSVSMSPIMLLCAIPM